MIPGWIDLQINGYNGVNFSDIELSHEKIEIMNTQLFNQGIIGYCPTIISSDMEIYKHNLPLIAEASGLQRGAQILGIHLEGPFINPENGYRGVHKKGNIISPSIEIFDEFRVLSGNNISLVTLAPELEGAEGLIRHITKTGDEAISIGHTNSNPEIIKKSIDLGVKAATHVGNGLPNLINRHKNPIWSILSDERISGLFITDGFHLPEEFIIACLNAKGISNFIVVSDIMHFAGMPSGIYQFNDDMVVLEENRHLHIMNSSQLSGSASNMMQCINHLNSIVKITESGIKKIGYENPLKLINRKMDNRHLNQGLNIKNKNNEYHVEIEK